MKKISASAIIFFVLYLLNLNVSASSEINITQAIITDEKISAYINAPDITDCTALLGTSECEIRTYSKAGDLPSNTLILIDTSGSMPKDIRSKTKELLEALIDSKQENESFSIASIGTEMNFLCDYTADRYELVKAIENLEYNQNYTNIYSALDEALNSLPTDSFGKIIIISDGKENNEDGITYDEILMSVSETLCPIYTIGVESHNQESLKKFYAFSRNSSARSYTINSGTDVSEVCRIINETREFTCIDVTVPDGSADGSMKYLKISGKGFECGCDVRMPVVYVPEKNGSETSAEITDTQTAATVIEPIKENNNSINYIFIAAAGAVVIVCVIVIIFFTAKSKKSKQTVPDTPSASKPSENEVTKVERKNAENAPTSINEFVIKLTDINAPEHSFRCALGEGVIIGRNSNECMIAINYDGHISRRHCRIYRKNGKMFIENLSEKQNVTINEKHILDKVTAMPQNASDSSGGTRMLIRSQNTAAVNEKEIFSGDIIRIGHTSLRFEII